MRALLIIPVFLIFQLGLFGQAISHPSYTQAMTIKKFPLEKQICGRTWATNTAKVVVQGTVAASSNYDQVQLSVSTDTMGNFDDLVADLVYSGDSATFEFNYLLPASFLNHEFVLYGLKDTIKYIEWKAVDVVAGDIFLINGQSNAQAYLSPMPEDVVPYTRSYKNNQWNALNHSFPGRWGGHLAKVMADYLGYPIGVFNFADGALPIHYFQKDLDDTLSGNYGRMLQLFAEAGGVKPVAAFWFHGEANGWDTPLETYKMAYDTLHNSWKESFGIQASFLYQLRFKGCTHPYPYVFEAQREIAEETPDINIMSTTNADQDSCHYRWEDGYRALAERMAQVVKAKIYGDNTIPAQDFAPNVKKIELYNPSTLRITFEPAGVPLSVMGDPTYDFRHEETGKFSSQVWTAGDTLIVHIDTTMNVGDHFSYLGHPGPFPDWVVTPSGVGILEFYNRPIVDYIVSNAQVLAPKIDLAIYPNPIENTCYIDWHSSEKVEIKVIDALGRVTLRKKQLAEAGIHLDFSNLPNGIYQVVVQSKQMVGVGKVVKL